MITFEFCKTVDGSTIDTLHVDDRVSVRVTAPDGTFRLFGNATVMPVSHHTMPGIRGLVRRTDTGKVVAITSDLTSWVGTVQLLTDEDIEEFYDPEDRVHLFCDGVPLFGGELWSWDRAVERIRFAVEDCGHDPDRWDVVDPITGRALSFTIGG